MSTPSYFISPELLRELDGVRSVLESQILEDEEYGTVAGMKKFFVLRGFNEAMALITNLSHGYEETAENIKNRLMYPEYEGMLTDFLDEEGA